MSFANFGIGLNAFAQGLNQGLDLGTKIKKIRQDNQIERTRKEAVGEAQAQREAAIGGMIQTGSRNSPDGTMTLPDFSVAGKSYGTETEARKAAEGEVGSMEDFFNKVAAPRIQNAYMEAGDIQKAEAWGKWIENKQVQNGMKHWSDAVKAAQMGDDSRFMKSLQKAYNARGYFDDGIDAKEVKPLKSKNGDLEGYSITFRDKATGKDYTQTFRGMEDLYRAGVGMLSPSNVFETGYKEVMAAQAQRAELAKEDRKFQRDIVLTDRKGEQTRATQAQRDAAAMDRTVTGKQLDAANASGKSLQTIQAKEQYLRQAGYTDAQLKELAPAIVGARQADPTKLRAQAFKYRMENDLSGQFKKLSPDEQAAQIDQDVKVMTGTPETPAQGGLPQQSPQTRGPMIYDTKTGKMVPYQR